MQPKTYTRPDGSTLSQNQFLALALVEQGMRNSILEEMHADTYPSSMTSDYSDVKVVTPFGEIPWNKLSRISDDEMKLLMVDVVDRVFSLLEMPELIGSRSGRALRVWKKPELHEAFLRFTTARRSNK